MRSIAEQGKALSREMAFFIMWNPRSASVECIAAQKLVDETTLWCHPRDGKRLCVWEEGARVQGMDSGNRDRDRQCLHLVEQVFLCPGCERAPVVLCLLPENFDEVELGAVGRQKQQDEAVTHRPLFQDFWVYMMGNAGIVHDHHGKFVACRVAGLFVQKCRAGQAPTACSWPPSKYFRADPASRHDFTAVNNRIKRFELLGQRQLGLANSTQEHATIHNFDLDRYSAREPGRLCYGSGDTYREAVTPLLYCLVNRNCSCHLDHLFAMFL